MFWLLLTSALAGGSEAQHLWELTQMSLLDEALTGDMRAAENSYESIAHAILPPEETRQLSLADPALPRVLYWLGRARWTLGDIDGARDALDRCIRTGLEKGPCLDLRSRIDLENDAVHELPVAWDFEDALHGVFHPRRFWHRGSIRIIADETSSLLEWSTTVDGSTQDELVVAFRSPQPAPKTIRLVVWSGELDGALQVVLEDIEGQTYIPEAKPIRVAQQEVSEIILEAPMG